MSNRPDFIIRNIHQQLTESALTYRVLAEKADDQALMELFEEMSALRGSMISALTHEVEALGEEMPLPGTIGGIVDRIWLRVRDSIARPVATALLDECERAEARLLEHYDEALAAKDLPTHMRTVLEQQRVLVASKIATLQRAGRG